MPTPLSHAAPALVAGAAAALVRPGLSWRALLAGVVLAVAPDIDVIGFHLGVPYGHLLGHRGLSHSLAVAVLGAAALFAAAPRADRAEAPRRLFLYLFFCAASHGLLDALTDGGRGVALWAPFDNTRVFLPVRPIPVAPLSLRAVLASPGRIRPLLVSEFLWIWLPALVLAGLAGLAALRLRPRPTRERPLSEERAITRIRLRGER